jgi:hypothetical protein
MAMELRTFTRTGNAPDLVTLGTALAPLLAVANAGSFHLRVAGASVVIEQGSFAGVDLAAVQNAINAAPDDTDRNRAKDLIDAWPIELKALLLVLIDELNRLRTQPTTAFGAITPAQAIAAVKAKADTL